MSLLVFGIILPWLIVTLCLALGAWIGFQLIHQNGRLLARLEGLEQRLAPLSLAPGSAPGFPAPSWPEPQPQAAPAPPPALPLGSPAPAFALPDLEGQRRSLADFGGRKRLLVFFNPGCGFCTLMAPDLAALPTGGENGQPLPVLVSTGGREANRELVRQYGLRCPVLLQEGMEVAAQYQCHGTPMGYRLDEQGNIASELAVGGAALLALVGDGRRQTGDGSRNGHADLSGNGNGHGALGGSRALAESKVERNGLAAGTPAPDFNLPRLGGGELSLSAYRGQKVLMVFSDPNCGPCDLLVPQLQRQYRASPEVQVLMVSRGEEEANQAKAAEHGLTFPIGLQRQWEVSRAYGMFATPIAYLIDEQGIIAAEVAVGVEPILALLTSTTAPANGKAEERCGCGKPLSECNCGRQRAKAAAGRRRGR